MTYTTGRVMLTDVAPVLAQYDPAVRWNGWLAAPLLDALGVETVLSTLESLGEDMWHEWSPDGAPGSLVVVEGGGESSQTIDPDEDGLYSLGAFGWTWVEAGPTMGDVVVGDRIVAPRDASLYRFAEGATVVVEEIEEQGEGHRLYSLGDHEDGVLYGASYPGSTPVEFVDPLPVREFRRLVLAMGPGFHPDNSGADYVSLPDGYTPEQVDEIVGTAFGYVDPYVYGLAVLEGEI